MFEKEAEEYTGKVHRYRDNLKELIQDEDVFDAFIDGAEFGYNKALEQCAEKFAESNRKWQEVLDKANEWHKPNEKLPEECSLVLAYLFEETEPTICEYVVSNQWECLPKRIVFCSNDQVRLWKEIVLPKESE